MVISSGGDGNEEILVGKCAGCSKVHGHALAGTTGIRDGGISNGAIGDNKVSGDIFSGLEHKLRRGRRHIGNTDLEQGCNVLEC